ncbi:MAG: hypothetical protein KDI88_06735 [Gammaproteobacteria bacterium]|nr:hypothetical protein [Gammaproteobacteria bacterium]
MQLTTNIDKFDELQALFIREICDKVRIKLEEAGIKGLEMEEITASIAFSIASTIDDTSGVEVDGVEVHPYLTFRDDDDNLVHSGDNSYIYEFVPGALKKLFDV